jgi:RNA polymerase sigma factor (TIGR02999 family)
MKEITRVLDAVAQGEPEAASRLMELVYGELRRLAAVKLGRETPGHSLQTTALVHEAYLRLLGGKEPRRFQDSGHFFAAAAAAMRRILIDSARRRQAQKRGGGMRRHAIDAIAAPEPDQDLLALNEALEKLAAKDPVKVRLVELRYFAGLTGEQVAEVLGISPTTADRHWAYARAWLRAEMGSD